MNPDDVIYDGQWFDCVSSNVTGFRYDFDSQELYVRFHNLISGDTSEYVYFRVPEQLVRDFMNAGSAGKFVHQRLKLPGYAGQSPYDEREISSFVGREKARYVFDEKNSGATLSNQASKLVKESRLLPSKPSPRPHSSQRDILAGETSCPDIGNSNGCWVVDRLDVLVPLDGRPVLFED